jgi:xylan 1,4-beta-xylosidase
LYNFISYIPMIDSKMYLFSDLSLKQPLISHHTCRFLTILNSSLVIDDGTKQFTLKKNDTLYIPNEQSYKMLTNGSTIILYICFHPYFLLDTIGFEYRNIQYNSIDTPLESSNDFNLLIASLATAISNTFHNNTFPVYSKAFEILNYVSRNFIPSPIQVSPIEKKLDIKLDTLREYISSNYTKSITLTDAADALDYTPPYLSNFIKKNLNITFNDLLNDYRLEASLLLLKYTNANTYKIAALCGFPNITSYIKTFKTKFNVKPDDFLLSFPLTIESDLNSDFTEITQSSTIRNYILNFMNYALNTNTLNDSTILERKQINTRHRKEFYPYWKTLINVGCANDFEKPAFKKHLSMIQNDLNFKYGRLSGCLQLTRSYKLENKYTYDFSIIFEIIDFFKSIHLIPFLDIDNKPFRIYKEDENTSKDYKTFLNADKYDDFLLTILPYFIKGCINRYGFDDFSKWKFEVWRRYNPTMTSLEEPADYFKRFTIISDIFKSINCEFSLGGPGFNSFLEIDYFEQLISVFENTDYKPDFISAYYFPYSPLTPNDHTHANGYNVEYSPNKMLLKINQLKEVLNKNGFSDTPFYITEYTPYIITGNYVNDSTYPATYIFRQVIDNYGKTDALGYWLASDLSLDYSLPPSPLFGGNGIVSRNGIKKSSYYAFDFLNKLGYFLIARGEHYIITASDEYKIQVLIYYNNEINNYFSDDPMNSKLLHYPYYGFVDAKPLKFQLYLTNMLSGKYSINVSTLDLTHGNVLNIWGHLNHMKEIPPADIEYMKQKSIPSVHQHIEDINDTFLLHTTLGSNEAKLYTIEVY